MPNGDNKNREAGGGNKWAVMGGIALNVEYTRKYGFDATAAAKVTAKLVAVPPPTLFQEAVQADYVGRTKRAAALTVPVVKPPEVLPPVTTPPVTTIPPPLPPTPASDEDEEFSTLSLIVVDKAGVDYTLDDGVTPPSEGRVAEDGMLIHGVSKRSKGCVITFKDGSEPIELRFDQAAVDEDEEAEESDSIEEEDIEPEDDQIAEELQTLADEEDYEPVLSFVVPEKAGKKYKLNDGVNPPSEGVIAEDGTLIYPVSPEATGATLEIEGEPEAMELNFAPVMPPPVPDPGSPPQATPANLDNDEKLKTISWIEEEKAGVEYTLDDSVGPVTRGRVAEDGNLTLRVSKQSRKGVITFADDAEPLELIFDESLVDPYEEDLEDEEDEYSDVWEELEEDEVDDKLDDLSEGDSEEDDEPVLSLVILEKVGKAYTLNDGKGPERSGVVAEDGSLIHVVSRGAETVTLRFEDDPEPIEVKIAS